MLGIINYPGFLLSAILLNLTPGADTIYILSKTAVGGRRRGIVSALGISTGCLVHTVLAALGLSAILSSSATAFNLMKLLGAGYLIAMGVRTIRSKESLFQMDTDEKDEGLWTVYRQGVLTNVLNPKVALFFLALLPQFVETGNRFGPIPFLVLGLTFCITGTFWCVFVACIGTFFNRILRSTPSAQWGASKITGGIYVLLGLNVLRARIES